MNLVEGIDLPRRERWVELDKALLEDANTGSADNNITIEHVCLLSGIVYSYDRHHIVPVIDLGNPVVQKDATGTKFRVESDGLPIFAVDFLQLISHLLEYQIKPSLVSHISLFLAEVILGELFHDIVESRHVLDVLSVLSVIESPLH